MAQLQGHKARGASECARLITEMTSGAYIERHKQSLNNFLDKWERDWANNNLSAKTAERYFELRACTSGRISAERPFSRSASKT